MNEKEMNLYLKKFQKCPFCKRRHIILEQRTLSEKLRKRKLSRINCHIRHGFYRGSYIDKDNRVVDVLNCHDYLVKKGIISAKEEVYIITLGNKGEEFIEEEEVLEEPYENYELLQQIDTEEYFSGEEV